MIEIRELHKTIKKKTAVSISAIKLANGKRYGILGAPDSGGLDFLRILTGAEPFSGGTVRVNGFDIQSDPVRALGCVGYVPARPSFYPNLTAFEVLSFVADARGFSYERSVRRIQSALSSLGLEGVKDRLVSRLTLYENWLLALAVAILHTPEFLMIEDPFSFFSQKERDEARSLILSACEKKTLFFSTCDVGEARMICDHVLLFSDGEVVLNAPAEEIPDEIEMMGSEAPTNAVTAPRRKSSLFSRLTERSDEYEVIEEQKGDSKR